jgi:zinc transport system ATP-binding protein
MQDHVIEAKGLDFTYKDNEMLSGITFQAGEGDYIGIVGPNGSGKTTLVRIILGLASPSSGGISVFGQPVTSFDKWQKIGYLPQKITAFNPIFPATVKEVVALGLLAGKNTPKTFDRKDEAAVEKALSLLGIDPIKDRLMGELSGGQQQRTLLAKALVHEPELLILDEPTLALDPDAREKFFDILAGLHKTRKVTILLVSHDIGTIGKYATKLLYLDKKIIFYGGFDEFCKSTDAGKYFGPFSQHIICHRHDVKAGD